MLVTWAKSIAKQSVGPGHGVRLSVSRRSIQPRLGENTSELGRIIQDLVHRSEATRNDNALHPSQVAVIWFISPLGNNDEASLVGSYLG